MYARKSELTVVEAVKIAYDNSPNIFHSVIFIMDVRRLLNRPSCMDGTILRRLRELRADGTINYRILNAKLSIYEKILR
jgi:hypothetical protein